MLRINAIPNTSAGKNYYKSADYHLEGQEQPAFWHGQGAEMLGLSGEVRREDFEKLCDNLKPDGSRLTARQVSNRRVGYDFTFSVPKSVSLAATLGLDDRLPDAFRAAVADTMGEMEREMETRVRKAGAFENRRTGNMLWCDFLHTTSRPIGGQPDPQLHIHAVVFNATYDREEDQWKAGEFAHLKANAPYFQSVFRSRLANRLQQMGYEVRPTKGDFELVGMPERAIQEFSRRTEQIEKLADQLGVKRPESKAKLGATSREKKTKGLTWDNLLRLWSDRLRPGEMDQIAATTRDALHGPLATHDMSKEAVSFAIDHLTERQSVVPERKVVTEALRWGIGSVTPESVYQELGRRKDLIRRAVGGQVMVTTQGVLAEEKAVLQFAQQGRGRYRPLSSARGSDAEHLGKPGHPALSPSQQAAVRHVLTSPDRLILVRGAAGTGKTTLTRAALAQVTLPWVILAPSAEASRGVLRRDGFAEADTLAKFLSNAMMQEQARGGLIWLDEASLAGARDVARLVELADRLNARLVLSGDRRQHKSVARGDMLAMLEDRAGLPVATVSEIQRQKGDYKQVAELLSRGQMAEAVGKLDAMGWVQDAPSHARLADDYLTTLGDGRSALIVVPTHAEGEQVTAAIRQRLAADGTLTAERPVRMLRPLNLTATELKEARKNPEAGVYFTRFAAYREETQRLAVGDVLRTTAGITDSAGRKIDSGASLTLTGWTDAGNMRVRTACGAERVLKADVGHIAAGYTATSQAGQGKTVDHVMLWMPQSTFPAVRMDTAYTSGTRGRERLTIYTNDRAGLLEAIQRQDHRMLASDLVRRHRRGVRDRLRRHIGFLRHAAMRVMGRDHQPEMQHETGEIALGR